MDGDRLRKEPGGRFGRFYDVLNGAAFVAMIAAAATIVGIYIQPNNDVCRIATDFLMDDAKDKSVVDEATARRLRALYVSLAEQNCKGD